MRRHCEKKQRMLTMQLPPQRWPGRWPLSRWCSQSVSQLNTISSEASHILDRALISPCMLQADIAMKLAQEVSAAEDKLHSVQQTARKSLAATLVKDRDAKMAQQALITSQDALESAKGGEKAIKLSAESTQAKIHKQLAKEIVKVEDATSERERAQRGVSRAEKKVDRAETPEDKEDAETKLAAATSALTQVCWDSAMTVILRLRHPLRQSSKKKWTRRPRKQLQ